VTVSLRERISIRKDSHLADGFARPLPLMQVAAKVSQALRDLDADIRAGGFGQNSRGLARELYASFAATAVATHQTEAETLTWAIGRGLAVNLDAAGASQSARILLAGLIELAEDYGNAKSLELLGRTKEAVERRMARPHLAAGAMKLSDLYRAAGASLLALQRTVASTLAAASAVGSDADHGQLISDSPGEDKGNTPRKLSLPLFSSELVSEIVRHSRTNGRSVLPLWWHRHHVRASVLGAAAGIAVVGLTYSLGVKDGALGQHPLVASSEVASSPTTAPSVNARLVDGRRSAMATTIVAGDDEGVVNSWSQGVRKVWKETFQQIGLWLNKREPMAKRIATPSASQSEPLLDLKTHDGAKAVQARLKSLGYYRYKVDGVWGPKSAAALSSFRRDAGLGSNTAWDLNTQSVLMGAKQ
jgi:hypothetical protein